MSIYKLKSGDGVKPSPYIQALIACFDLRKKLGKRYRRAYVVRS